MLKQQERTTALYCRLSRDDEYTSESMSIQTQVIIYKGRFLPPNIYYDCGSFVVNRKAVVGKEKKPFNRYKSNTKGAAAYDDCYIKTKPALSKKWKRRLYFICYSFPCSYKH